MDHTIVGVLMKHGEDDFSLWQPEIPADAPMLVALLDKYGDNGCSVRGNGEEVRNEILPLLGDKAQDVHVIMYYDPACEYTGLDVFSSFDSALAQFDGRLADEEAEHEDDPAWIELSTRNVEDHELHFRASSNYEVIYRCEKVQQHAQMKSECFFCSHYFCEDQMGSALHRCSRCGKLFCAECYKAMTGCFEYEEGENGATLCPTCVLETSIRSCLSEWLGDYADQMPESFFKDVYNDVYHASGFNGDHGFNDADIRIGFARVIARQFHVDC